MTARTDRIAVLLKEATTLGKEPGVAVVGVFPDGEMASTSAGTRDTKTGDDMRAVGTAVTDPHCGPSLSADDAG